MNAPARALSSRRDILKGGALIVGFKIAENIDSPLPDISWCGERRTHAKGSPWIGTKL
jgi:hypothetical protein